MGSACVWMDVPDQLKGNKMNYKRQPMFLVTVATKTSVTVFYVPARDMKKASLIADQVVTDVEDYVKVNKIEESNIPMVSKKGDIDWDEE